MNDPDIFIVANKGELPECDGDCEVGSNFDWIVERAKKHVEILRKTQVIYKLVPMMEVSIEVTTKVLIKDLTTNTQDDHRDWAEANKAEEERNK